MGSGPDQLRSPNKQRHVQRENREINHRHNWSHGRTHPYTDFANLSAKVGRSRTRRRLFFCGSAAPSHSQSTIFGEVQSGEPILADASQTRRHRGMVISRLHGRHNALAAQTPTAGQPVLSANNFCTFDLKMARRFNYLRRPPMKQLRLEGRSPGLPWPTRAR
jgi:hypothetical protein